LINSLGVVPAADFTFRCGDKFSNFLDFKLLPGGGLIGIINDLCYVGSGKWKVAYYSWLIISYE
jgi:hypothetical protein